MTLQGRQGDLEQQILSSAGWRSPSAFSWDENKEHFLWFIPWNPTAAQVPWCWEGLWGGLLRYPGVPSEHPTVQMGGSVRPG